MLDQAEEMICFAALIENGTITKTAAHLQRSKAHISRKLSNLEMRYKVKLFHRSTRSMKLTDAGEKLQNSALQVYHEHQKLDQLAKHVQNDLSGYFGISISDSGANFMLSPILPLLFEKFPNIQFNIHVSNTPLDLIGDKIDLSIRSGGVGDENLVARKLGSVKEKTYVASTNKLALGQINSPLDLRNFKILTNDYTLKDGKLQLENGDELLFIEPPDLAMINRYKVIADILPNSDFVGVLPEYAARQAVENGELVDILPNWHNGEWPLYMLHPYQMPVPLKLKAVSQFIGERFSKMLAG